MAQRPTWFKYMTAISVVLILTLIAYFGLRAFDRSNLVMLYLLVVTGIAYRYGRGSAIIASILSVAAFDFFFVPPHLTFAVSDLQYVLTFVIMLTVGLMISTLTAQVREQAEQAEQREQRTAALYAMTRELASTRGVANLLKVAAHHISAVFNSQTVILLPMKDHELQARVGQDEDFIKNEHEMATAHWVFEHGQMAGHKTSHHATSRATYLPLIATRGTLGVLAVALADSERLENPDQLHLLETFANQTSVAIERAYLAEEAQAISLQVETERLRNSLLSSVSHDLRTPLASITGAASSLLDHQLDPTTHRALAKP